MECACTKQGAEKQRRFRSSSFPQRPVHLVGRKGLQQRICFLLISVGACSCNDWAYVIFCSAWTYWFHSLNCLNAFMQWNVNTQLFISEMWFTPTKVKPCYNSALGQPCHMERCTSAAFEQSLKNVLVLFTPNTIIKLLLQGDWGWTGVVLNWVTASDRYNSWSYFWILALLFKHDLEMKRFPIHRIHCLHKFF